MNFVWESSRKLDHLKNSTIQVPRAWTLKKKVASSDDLCNPRFLHLARVDVQIGDSLRASTLDLVIICYSIATRFGPAVYILILNLIRKVGESPCRFRCAWSCR
ncbi:hypothetical protein K449DRAFT_385195 [Hypoxylon sp. EC38]|nr:hypothetical protein K449DRAFT_385195 [Hypoxylon sp. EC38]